MVSDSGDTQLFKIVEKQIIGSIPTDSCEWKRSYGRPTRSITFKTISCRPLEQKFLEQYKSGDWSIIDQPILYIYCTECNDVEVYKSQTKEEIDLWMKSLANFGVEDWMILLVETMDIKKTKNLLPRTTVLDKIRLDFGAKQGDRVISVLNPTKFETKATESFRSMIQRIRYLMLSGYNRNINRYEELIRHNRDNRQKEGWSFLKYFLLQEDLAFVLEMLGLHTEALVQYDELDALFSQFILNSVYTDKPKWLKIFEQPCDTFCGINLSKRQLAHIRSKINDGTVTLLELRTYILERQCTLLNASDRPWEIAERLMPFLYATEKEIEILNIELPEGALACWEFVCAMEILNLCDTVQDSKDIYKCSQHSAAIWNLAKDKLYELGDMGGLLPNQSPTSEQIHKFVLLTAGLETEVDQGKVSPRAVRKAKRTAVEQLKEALSSNKTFQKLYLELSELAISTFKHVSRLRFARLVGYDLGDFYTSLNELQKAVVFYTDILRDLKLESWSFLSGQVLLKLAGCYKKLKDQQNFIKTCAVTSCCVELDILDRMTYFDEMLKLVECTPPQTVSLEEHFNLLDIHLINDSPLIQDSFVDLVIKIESNFPREIFIEKLQIALEMCEKEKINVPLEPGFGDRMPMKLILDYKEDGTLNCASVACDIKGKQLIRRTSSSQRKASVTPKADFSNCLQIESVSLKPGINLIELNSKVTRVGVWELKQMALQFHSIEFLSDVVPQKAVFEVTTKPSSAVLSFMNLIAGIEQNVKLVVAGGSFHFSKDASILLKCSKNLQIRRKTEDILNNCFERENLIPLTNFQPFEERTIELEAICDFVAARRDDKQIEQKVTLQVPWSRHEIQIPLHFTPALTASCRLHSSGNKKFLQVINRSNYDGSLLLCNAEMRCTSAGVTLNNINPASQNELTIKKGLDVSFLWELQVEPLKTEQELPVIQVDYSIQFAESTQSSKKRTINCTFDVKDYTTLYRIEAKIEPSELCRVGSVCQLQLTIKKVHENPFEDLMFEVLADQNFWAVCGRSAGVISLKDNVAETIPIDVMPLNVGFLPLPSIRLSKYIAANQGKITDSPRLLPFQPGQIYNSTKSIQIHVLAAVAVE